MAYSLKETEKERKEREKREAEAAKARRRTNVDARVQRVNTSAPSQSIPVLQNNPITKTTTKPKNALTDLMESTGINPMKKESKLNPDTLSTTTQAKRVVLPQVASSPLLRNALRDMGKDDILLDIYDNRQKTKKTTLTGIKKPQTIRETFPVTDDDIKNERDRAKYINNSFLSPQQKKQLIKDNSKITTEGAAQRGVVNADDEFNEILKKYNGRIMSKANLEEIIKQDDELYEGIREYITQNTGFIIPEKEAELGSELMEFYNNYPTERKKYQAQLEDYDRLLQLSENMETYSNYVRSKNNTPKNYDFFGKKFEGVDENGKLKFKNDVNQYHELKTGNTVADNFIIPKKMTNAKETPLERAEQELKRVQDVNRYFENELKPIIKLYEDMEKDPVYKKSIQQKYATDEEYRQWYDRKMSVLNNYRQLEPYIKENAEKAGKIYGEYIESLDLNNLKYIDKYTETYGSSPMWEEINKKYLANKEIGQMGKGNIDLYNRPIYKNSDGSISTVESISIYDNGEIVLIPTVITTDRGRVTKVSDGQAVEHYRKTGEYLGKFDTQQEADEYAEKLHDAQDFYYNSRYKSTANGKEATYDAMQGRNTETGYDDIMYEYINQPDNVKDIVFNNTMVGGMGTYLSKLNKEHLLQMTQDEVEIFNYLKRTFGDEKAYEFVANITNDLNLRRRLDEQKDWQKYANEHPIQSSIGATLMTPLKSLAAIGMLADYGENNRIEENLKFYDIVRKPNTYRQTVAEDVIGGGLGGWAYNTGMSMGDQGMRAALSGGNSGISLTIAGTGAMADAVIEAKDNGLSDEQALWKGVIAGTAEAVTEKIGFDNMFKTKWTKDGFIKHATKVGLTEATEEVASADINAIADVIISGDKSKILKKIEENKRAGMSEAQAVGMAIASEAIDRVPEAASGFVSGFLLSGGTSFANTYGAGMSAISDSKEFKNYTDKIINADVSDYTGEVAELQDAVKTYVEKAENAKTKFGQIINAGMAVNAASEYQGTPKVIATEDISKEDRAKLNKFSKAANVNIIYSSIEQDLSKDYKGGFYVPGTNTMVIDKGTSVLEILDKTSAHEVGHTAEGTRWYDAYKRRVIDDINAEGGKSFDALVKEKEDFYRSNGVNVKNPESEVIADYTSKLINDHSLIDKMVKRDYNTANLLLDGMKDIYNNLKTKFTGKEIGGIEETVRYLERAIGMRNTEGNKGNKAFFIVTLPNGIKYVQADRKVIFTNNPDNWGKELENYINESIRRGEDVEFVTDDGDVIKITEDTAWKVGDMTEWTEESFPTKMNMGTHIDELLRVSRYLKNKDAGDRTKKRFKPDSFDYRTAFFRDFNGDYYRVHISAGVFEDGKVAYSIGKDIQKRSFPDVNGSSSEIQRRSNVKKASTDRIPYSEEYVNTYSTQNLEKDSNEKTEMQLALEKAGIGDETFSEDKQLSISELTPEQKEILTKNQMVETAPFKRWFGKSKFANEDGTPTELYHGTTNFGFTKFDMSKMDDKTTIFLTDAPEVASTYSGVEGIKSLKDVYGKDIEKMTLPELADELNQNSTRWNEPGENKTKYTVYNFENQNKLIETVNKGIEDFSDFVDNKLQEYKGIASLNDDEIRAKIKEELKGLETDKENSEFLQKSKYKHYTEGVPKLITRLENLSKDLKSYNYDKLSTPIYYLLHYTSVLPADKSTEISTLEKNIRLMNKLRKADISDGVIVEEGLDGYHIELMDKEKAITELKSEVSRGNYAFYARAENPLIVDAKGHYWNDIRGWTDGLFPTIDNVEIKRDENDFYLINKTTGGKITGADAAINGYTEEMSESKLKSFLLRNAKNMAAIRYESINKTRDIAKIAKEYGFDGVKFENIIDSGGKSNDINNDKKVANVYVVFSPTQVKSATDNIGTYDINNEDFQYSVSNLTPEQKETLAKDQEKRDAEGKSKGVIISELTPEQMEAVKKNREMMGEHTKGIGKTEKENVPLSRKMDRIVTEWVDRFRFIERFDEEAKKIGGEAKTEDRAYIMAMNSLNSDGSVMYVIKNQMTDLDGNINIGKGLFPILEGLKSKEEVAEFEKYLIARHAAEWLAKNKGGAVKHVFGNENDSEEIQRNTAATIEKEYPHFKGIAEELYKFQRDVLLNFGVKGGLLGQKTADIFFKTYPDYVPFYRNTKDTGLEGITKEFADLDLGIEKAEGGKEKIISPLESIIKNTAKFISLAKKNAVMQAIYRQSAKIDGLDMFVEVIPEKAYESDTDEKQLRREPDVVSVMVDGSRKYLRFNDVDFLKAVTGMNDEKELGSVWRFFASAGNVFKTLTTSGNAMFSLGSNVWRDIDTAYKSSAIVNPGKFAVEYSKALGRQFKTDENFQRYLAMGGRWETSVVQNRNAIKKLYGELSRKNDPMAKKLLYYTTKGLYDGIQGLSDRIETTPRFMEFVNTLNKTGDIQKAIYDSGEVTTNFKRRGTKSRQLEALLPYTNSRIQGTKKLVNLWKTHPARTAAKMIGVATVVSLLKAGLRDWVDDEEYKDLSTYTKDNYHLFAIGNGKYISIPKSQNFAIFDTIADRTLELVKEKNPEAFKNIASYILNNLLPVDFFGGIADGIEKGAKEGDAREVFSGVGAGIVDTMNSMMIIGTIAQIVGNRDFKGSKIVPSQYEKLKPEEQYDENTTYLAKFLGKATGISPFQIDHVLSSNFGYLAKLNESFGREKKDYLLGLGNKFVKNAVYSNEILSGFYDKKSKIDEEYNTQNQKGKVDSNVAMERYFYNNASGVISNLYKLQDEAKTPAEKENIRREINKYVKSLSNQYDQKVKDEILKLLGTDEGTDVLPYATPDMSVDEYGYNNKLSANKYAKLSEDVTKNIISEYQKVMDTDVYKNMSDSEKVKALSKIKNVSVAKTEYDAFSGGRDFLEELTGQNSEAKYRAVQGTKNERDYLNATSVFYPEDRRHIYKQKSYESIWTFMNSAEKNGYLTEKLAVTLANGIKKKAEKDFDNTIFDVVAYNAGLAGSYSPLEINYASVFSWQEDGVKYELPMDEGNLAYVVDVMDRNIEKFYRSLYLDGYWTEGGETEGPGLGEVTNQYGKKVLAFWDNMSPKQRNDKLSAYKSRLVKEVRAMLIADKKLEPQKVSTIWDVVKDKEEGEE